MAFLPGARHFLRKPLKVATLSNAGYKFHPGQRRLKNSSAKRWVQLWFPSLMGQGRLKVRR